MSDEAIQESSAVVSVILEAARLVGFVGASISRKASVVNVTALLSTETFPAASRARTVNVYVVEAERSVI